MHAEITLKVHSQPSVLASYTTTNCIPYFLTPVHTHVGVNGPTHTLPTHTPTVFVLIQGSKTACCTGHHGEKMRNS